DRLAVGRRVPTKAKLPRVAHLLWLCRLPKRIEDAFCPATSARLGVVMPSCRFDVLGLGNAIVDVISTADDDFLLAQGLRKGAMTLIDEARADALYAAMRPSTLVSGGSAANTIIGAASLGCRAAFIGKLRSDEAGAAFVHDIRAAKVSFSTALAEDGPATACCLVLVTPDGQRTMSTYLGASQNLTAADVDDEL